MATTRAGVRNRVREMLGDQDPANRVVSQFRYDGSISRNMFLIASKATMPRAAVSSVSISAGAYESTAITDTARSVKLVVDNATGKELAYVPWDDFNSYYGQDTANPRASGTAVEYTVRENTTAGLVIRVGPTPSANATFDVHYAAMPSALSTDSTSIPFSEELTRALDSFVAAEIASTLSEDKLAKLGVPRSSAKLWLEQGTAAIRDYNLRMGRLGTRQDRIFRDRRTRMAGVRY